MNNIIFIKDLELGTFAPTERPKEVREIYSGARRRIVEIHLREGETLPKHKAAEPITVLCLGGNGRFEAGTGLEESIPLAAGTFITLEANVEHAVYAEPDLHILVTKYKAE
jgi:quercetin dioxygenase-like cupin family protein